MNWRHLIVSCNSPVDHCLKQVHVVRLCSIYIHVYIFFFNKISLQNLTPTKDLLYKSLLQHSMSKLHSASRSTWCLLLVTKIWWQIFLAFLCINNMVNSYPKRWIATKLFKAGCHNCTFSFTVLLSLSNCLHILLLFFFYINSLHLSRGPLYVVYCTLALSSSWLYMKLHWKVFCIIKQS